MKNFYMAAILLIIMVQTSCNYAHLLEDEKKKKIKDEADRIFASSDPNLPQKDDMLLVYIPAGEFLMGSTDESVDLEQDAFWVEKPARQVYLDEFWIDQTEVTNKQYQMCVTDGSCTPPSSSSSAKRNFYYGISTFSDHPVIYVNWYQARDYCQWAGRRLPTEAEWEKAARGTDGRIFPWGNEFPTAEHQNFDDYVGDTTAVGSYPLGASPYGVFDMAGNVEEWTADWYDSSYYQYAPIINPQGPNDGILHNFRGGSWDYYSRYGRSSGREGGIPEYGSNDRGFRCAL